MYRPSLTKGIVTALLQGVAGAAALAAAVPTLATPSLPYPTYSVGPQADGSIVMSTNQTITPAGTLVKLGTPTRGKAIALNPNASAHNAAVLEMGASSSVQIIDLISGQILQSFSPTGDSSGSFLGIAYSADGTKLLFSQDSSHVTVANVDPTTGLLSGGTQIALPSPQNIGNAYPGGIAISADGTTAYVALNANNTLGVIDLTKAQPKLVRQIKVGNVPNSIVLSGNRAYVSNEGGRVAKAGDFTDLSDGTPIVSDPTTDSASTGTVSVVNLETLKVERNIKVGLHPTGMTLVNGLLYVANTYSDTVSAVDTTTDKVVRTISVGIPLPDTFGAEPTSVAVNGSTLYVTLFTVNSVAVVDLSDPKKNNVLGYIPTASTPSTIAFDQARNQLVVSNNKGIGTDSITVTNEYNDTAYNSHPDTGTVNFIPVPSVTQLADYTAQVWQNNHWDLTQNVQVGKKYVNPHATPVAIPEHIGEPSLIKHVFLIVKENRTYDQLFGDVTTANGNASLAVFGPYTPNQHAFLQRFATLDNVYAPSRQSADGHPWIVCGISDYADESQSPDWIRSYPGGNGYDEMINTPRGFLWDAATAQGLSVKLYGEWSGSQNVNGNYTWSDWYAYSQYLEGKTTTNPTTITPTTDTETSTVPSVIAILDPHYPSFNTGIPDQYRVDYWLPIFNNQEKTHSLPALTVIWLPDDHTSGYSTGFPIPTAAQADNDLALGRIVQAITSSPDWATSAIFVEEDDAQDGVDHVDGHRQPVQIISPYAVQSNGAGDHTTYTSASIDRTIEQILGLTPMTEFDLVASPMRTAFVNTPVNIAPYTVIPPTIALNTFPTASADSKSATGKLKTAWNQASNQLFKAKFDKADAVDENFLNHVIWYSATGFTRPYPGEKTVLLPSDLKAAGHSEEIED
ncbi:MAG: bifunctional YncE family protein/alkaline phosphatase family protein [Verrucomicrobia bacterium]|nr:bifunctional YncE family protein/alkaline phosphatase family protein [Verrucomicrobiota bacterium]